MKHAKFITLFTLLIAGLQTLHAQKAKNENYNLLIGTYTSSGKSEGIYVYQFNVNTGANAYRSKATGIANPSYLAISRNGKKVYAVSEAGRGKGSISAFDFAPSSGELKFINSVSSGGDGPCYVSVDDRNKFVFSANYGGGSLGAIRVNEDGSLNEDVQHIQHEGSSVNKENQSKPHVHSVVLSPDNKYLLATDLGTDKVHVYKLNPYEKQLLSPSSIVSTHPGAGPRHLTFHPNGKYVYVVNELNGSVDAYAYKNGKLTSLQTITMLREGFNGTIEAADIHCSSDGKFLYASNREESNEIVIYRIDKKGRLKFAGRQSVLGKAPRNFVIAPGGKYLIVANMNSDEIVVFNRNAQTGLLTDTGTRISIGSPVCLKFVAIE
jgi:6-phosphogluconolactonase